MSLIEVTDENVQTLNTLLAEQNPSVVLGDVTDGKKYTWIGADGNTPLAIVGYTGLVEKDAVHMTDLHVVHSDAQACIPQMIAASRIAIGIAIPDATHIVVDYENLGDHVGELLCDKCGFSTGAVEEFEFDNIGNDISPEEQERLRNRTPEEAQAELEQHLAKVAKQNADWAAMSPGDRSEVREAQAAEARAAWSPAQIAADDAAMAAWNYDNDTELDGEYDVVTDDEEDQINLADVKEYNGIDDEYTPPEDGETDDGMVHTNIGDRKSVV